MNNDTPATDAADMSKDASTEEASTEETSTEEATPEATPEGESTEA